MRIANHLSKTREIKDARAFLAKVARRISIKKILFTSDKLRSYLKAFLEVFGVAKKPANKARGRPRKERKVFPKGLLYGQIVKERKSGHLKCVERKAVVGTLKAIKALLAKDARSQVINTSIIERDNLSFRQHNPRTVRKTLSYSKSWRMHQYSVDLEDAVHNFVRVHSSLRIELTDASSSRRWQQQTPAMAKGLTDHVWSMRELVTYRLPSRE